ncbi:MAG: hypothetical protein DVB25_02340 [Verrucomicrobia bacterium]|nr:MAG: hypothetical protein DVB25_02340 [Verrucomicrobiota bacterium]
MRASVSFRVLSVFFLLHAASGGDPLDVELLSEQRVIRPGAAFCLGLHLRHPAGSHSYWQHPGIVGLATQVEWDLPPGIVAGAIQWPAPAVVKMAGNDAQGYEGETLLLIPLTAAAELATKSLTLTAKVSWMCCGASCNPAFKIPFAVTLPVGDAAEPNPASAALFAKFHAQVPKQDPAWQVAVKRQQDIILLSLHAPGHKSLPPCPDGIRFFTADGQVDTSQKQEVSILADGTIQIHLALSKFAPKHPAALPGVVVMPTAGQAGGQSLHLQINPAY